MPIEALPASTVRAIGASQVLHDAATVIKELVDNALDARATSIAIEISANTIDHIQVRDNGHGISPEDRELVARPHCTSKIISESDIQTIGGTSLGFRGEALASVAEMSGSLTISTRVEGEQVATALKINQKGEVIGQERASLPVGSTIKITDFIKANPVRRQIALKNPDKCLKRIKQILQSYAFARPNVRLALRVIKTKNDKGNWTYAPKPGGNAEDAAFKVVGAACASQCTWSVIEEQGFTFQAFLPRIDADVGKISNIGPFISIDARPISAAKGTPKQVVKIFRDAMKQCNADFDGAKDPFIYLEIVCPPESYDANIEPAKDDVLFENPNVVLGVAKLLFDTAYPEPPVSNVVEVGPEAISAERRYEGTLADENDFTTSLEPRVTEVPSQRSTETYQPDGRLLEGHDIVVDNVEAGHVSEAERSNHGRAFRTTMYGCDEEDLDFMTARPSTGRTEADFEELRQARKDVNVSNPWVMAKMNASLRKPPELQNDSDPQRRDDSEHEHQSGASKHDKRWQIDLNAPGLPTPRPSSPSPSTQDFHPSDHVRDVRLAIDGRFIGSQSLPPPLPLQPRESLPSDVVEDSVGFQSNRHPPDYDYTLAAQASEPPSGTPLHAIPDITAKPRRSPQKQMRQSQINTPYVSPVTDQAPREKVWFDHLEGMDQGRRRSPAKRSYQARANNGLVTQGELGDLVDDPRPLTPPRRNRDMRDFITASNSAASLIESRNYPPQKRARSTVHEDMTIPEQDENASALLNTRGFVAASELAAFETRSGPLKVDLPRPTKRRKTSETRVLRQISGNATVRNDPEEEYRPTTSSRKTSRRRRTTDGKTVHRTKSSLLPLERVPTGKGTHNVRFELTTSMEATSSSAGKIDEEESIVGWNVSATETYHTFVDVDLKSLTKKLYDVLINRASDGDVVDDLASIVRVAFAAHKQTDAGMDVV